MKSGGIKSNILVIDGEEWISNEIHGGMPRSSGQFIQYVSRPGSVTVRT